MKYIVLLLPLLMVATFTHAQIEISEYERSFKVDAHKVPAPNVEFTSPCGKVNIEVSEKMASGGCIGNLIRTYTATDDCGNKATAEQYLSLQDTTGPEIYGVPENVTVSGNEAPALPVVGAKDLGDKMIKVEVSETRNEKKLIRTWKATDKCGNVSEKSQTILFKE